MASKISSISTMAKHALLVKLARGMYSSSLAKSLVVLVSISLVFLAIIPVLTHFAIQATGGAYHLFLSYVPSWLIMTMGGCILFVVGIRLIWEVSKFVADCTERVPLEEVNEINCLLATNGLHVRRARYDRWESLLIRSAFVPASLSAAAAARINAATASAHLVGKPRARL